ncbi:MAG: retropepsin-like aspartic protease [Candidatus Poribacteria bacterium]|nr:retropepsin-like aspartic protease [Candidatus Poribacteria bacterium]
MGHISFNPAAKSIFLRLKISSINADTSRDVLVALDTGASTTMIPTEVATHLGYDLSNPNEQMMTASGIVSAKRITVPKLTAIGETVENIDVVCHDLPEGSIIEGLLGLNFLKHFDLNISFSRGTIELNSINTIPR